MVCCTAAAAVWFTAYKGSWLSSPPEEEKAVVRLANRTALASGGAARRPEEQQQQQQRPSLLGNAETGASLRVRVFNHYQLGANATTDLSLYPWEHVAEPYRETTLELARLPEGVEDGANVM